MNWQRLIGMLALVFALVPARAGDYNARTNTRFPIPAHYTLVNDYISMLRISRQAEIAKKLQALEKRNGTQIVLLTVPHVGDGGIELYAQQVFTQWNLGNNGQGNGVLFLVTHSGWYLATGPGIAGAIPDVTLARINREVMMPSWESDQISEGIERIIDTLIKASHDEETRGTAYDYSVRYTPVTTEQIVAMVLAALAAAYGATLLWLRRRKRLSGSSG